jgi:plastocyanin
MKKLICLSAASLLVSNALFQFEASAQAVVEVGQKNKEFTKKEITIKQGDVVRFKNEDPFFHNVFSLSDTKFFDLGSFPQGEHKDVKFEEAGEIEVECAIHPNMKMTIKVE